MKQILQLVRRAFLLILFAATCRSAMLAQSADTHVVKAGETLYRISVDYGVTVDAIMNANPGVTSHNLREGTKLTIPAKRPAAAADIPAAGKGVQESGEDSVVVTVTMQPYKVKKGDTMWSIAQAHNCTVDELVAANVKDPDDKFKVKKGRTINVPVKTVKRIALPPRGLSSVSVAIVLPLKGDGVEHRRSVEFYRGFLIALEAYKAAGKNITINVINEPLPAEGMAEVTERIRALQPDLVVGPLYPSHFADMSRLTGARTKVVVPFSSKVQEVTHKKGLYVINTPAMYETELACNLVLSTFPVNTRIVFVGTTGGNKSTLTATLRGRLADKGYSIAEVSDAASAEQLRTAASNASNVLFIPNDDSENVMAALLDKVKQINAASKALHVSTLGYAKWLERTAAYKNSFFAANTYMLSPQFFYPGTRAAMDFVAHYKNWFHTSLLDVTPAMAPLGYDCARCFIGGLTTYGHKFNTQTIEGDFLQSYMRFEQAAPGGGYVNRSMWLVHYRTDRNILKISAK